MWVPAPSSVAVTPFADGSSSCTTPNAGRPTTPPSGAPSRLLCIAGDDHRTPALLDGARRAASVTHGVFVRILDVGSDEGVAYVVEEDLGEARTLAELVTDGGVPGDEVRRITGEVAAALESAGQRGMHHLDLKPDDVLRTPDGDVRLRGLETASVRAGEDGAEAEDAARRDAVGVVALAYAGPHRPVAARRRWVRARPPPPGCPVAWPHRPRSPRACPATSTPSAASPSTTTRARPAPVTSPARSRRGPRARSWAARSPAPSPVVARDADDPDAADVHGCRGCGRRRMPRTAPSRPPTRSSSRSCPACRPTDRRVGRRAASADPDDGRPRKRPLGRKGAAAVVSGRRRRRGQPRPAPARHPAAGATAAARPPAVSAVDEADEATRVIQCRGPDPRLAARHPHRVTAVASRRRPSRPRRAPRRARRRAATPRPAGAAAAGAGAGAAVAGALGSVGGRVGNLAERAVDKVSELSPDTAPRADQGDLEAPAPLVPAEPLTKDESKLALGIVVGFVVLALVIGIYGVSRIGSRSGSPGDVAAPATRTTTVAPSSAAPIGQRVADGRPDGRRRPSRSRSSRSRPTTPRATARRTTTSPPRSTTATRAPAGSPRTTAPTPSAA